MDNSDELCVFLAKMLALTRRVGLSLSQVCLLAESFKLQCYNSLDNLRSTLWKRVMKIGWILIESSKMEELHTYVIFNAPLVRHKKLQLAECILAIGFLIMHLPTILITIGKPQNFLGRIVVFFNQSISTLCTNEFKASSLVIIYLHTFKDCILFVRFHSQDIALHGQNLQEPTMAENKLNLMVLGCRQKPRAL